MEKIMFFSQALLNATYVGGKVGKRTDAHEKAEFHRFKTQYLFKRTQIPRELYASRLIQHYLILRAIETQLQKLNKAERSPLSAFFGLSYLEQLWRTLPVEQDLIALGVTPNSITVQQIAPSTERYIEQIKNLSPKALLTHFLVHVAGFMHGGTIIKSKYIIPSNKLSTYQIPSAQYDFSSAASTASLRSTSPISLYAHMMEQVDKIPLSDEEYNETFTQCTTVYEVMVDIYDDLCTMHKHYNKIWFALLTVSIVTLGFIAHTVNLTLETSPVVKP